MQYVWFQIRNNTLEYLSAIHIFTMEEETYYQELLEIENALKQEPAIRSEFSGGTDESWKTSTEHDPLKKPFLSCLMCGKVFTKLSRLKTHEKVHTGEKPYSCSHCDYKFTQLSNLKRHERTHTGDKPYTCSGCKISFTVAKSLRSHKSKCPELQKDRKSSSFLQHIKIESISFFITVLETVL